MTKRSDNAILKRLRSDSMRRNEQLEVIRLNNASKKGMDWVIADAHIRHQLLSDTRMAPTWSRLAELPSWSFEMADKLLHEAVQAEQDYKAPYWRTSAERKDLLEEIAAKASALRQLVNKVTADIKPEDFAAIVKYWGWHSFEQWLQWSKSTELDVASLNYVRRWLEGTAGYLLYRPTFSDALEELARKAKEQMAEEPVLRQPGRENAPAQFVGKQIMAFFVSTTGSHRVNDAAVIASVVTGIEIDAANLARLVKTET